MWAHWGIFRRSDASEQIATVPRSRLILVLAFSILAIAGGVTMAVTDSFVVVMGIFGAASALLLIGFVPAYLWHISKSESSSRP